MGNIRILPDTIANRIAAGEVVLRPASVVRELMDNSLDAEAKHIDVLVERGGRSVIEVRDDGIGMDEDDALLAFERHATSKIRRPEDLMHISTLGFRGEALASIAAVSRVTLETRTRDRDSGTRVVIEGGKLKRVETIALPPGTRVIVRGLFYNMPARRKFLRGIQTELRYITQTVQDLALAYPEVTFRLRHHQRELVYYVSVSVWEDRLVQVFGNSMMDKMIPLKGNMGDYRLTGWISRPDTGSRTPETLYLFVNRRPIRDRWLVRLFRECWQRYGARWDYPHLVVFLELPPDQVDVNVHPSKLEVRFREPSNIQGLVRGAMERAFAAERPTVHLDMAPVSRVGSPPPILNEPVRLISQVKPTPPQENPVSLSDDPSRSSISVPRPEPTFPRLWGQFQACYLILEDEKGLLILDQHLVHERFLYETWSQHLLEGSLRSQSLLVPVVLEIGPNKVAKLMEYEDRWNKWGWSIKPFGPGAVSVNAAPAGVWPTRIESAIHALLDALESMSPDLKEWEHDVLKDVACKAAIKKGTRLSEDQMRFLTDTWYRLKVPQVCPHGRIMAVRLTLNDIHRAFGRTWNLQMEDKRADE